MKKFKAVMEGGEILLNMPFNPQLIEYVRQLAGNRFHVPTRAYILPVPSFGILVDIYGPDEFEMGDDVRAVLEPEQRIGYTNPTAVDPEFAPFLPTWAAVTTGRGYDAKDHQATGSTWLIHTPRGFLLDEMGLGKSKQWIDAVSHVASQNFVHGDGVTRVLVGCRAGNIDTWTNEIAKFAPTAIVNKFRGAKRRINRIPSGPLEFVLASYESIRKYYAVLATFSWDWICLDEGHAIKANPLNKQAEIARLIHTLDAPRKLIMTGTPMPNNPAEIYNQLLWLGLESRNWDQFERDTLITIELKKKGSYHDKSTKKIIGYKPIGVRQLRQKIAANVVRRTKDDVLNLPKKIRTSIPVELSAIEERMYLGAEEELRIYVNDNPHAEFSKIANSAQMVRLKQMTSDASLFSDKPFVSSKLKWSIEKVREAVESDQKVLIFSQFRHPVEQLRELLFEYSPAVITGDTSTTPRKNMEVSPRQVEVDKFQNDPECKVFIGTSAACRYGLTLNAASVEIFIDSDWSEDYNAQNEDRAHRIGQTKSVNIYRLEAILSDGRKTIDADIAQLIDVKQTFVGSMLRRAE